MLKAIFTASVIALAVASTATAQQQQSQPELFPNLPKPEPVQPKPTWPPTGMQRLYVEKIDENGRLAELVFQALPGWKKDLADIRRVQDRPWPAEGIWAGQISSSANSLHQIYLVMFSARLFCSQNTCPWAVVSVSPTGSKPIWQGDACDAPEFTAASPDNSSIRVCDTVIDLRPR